MSDVAAININYDSLSWILREDPREIEDPTYTVAGDRIQHLAEKYDFPCSIYVVGQDLTNPANASAVREWCRAGHEIGNHSYTHTPQFGSLPPDELAAECARTDAQIRHACGKKPTGFIAPGWMYSEPLVHTLQGLQYRYDTSLFPSWVMFGATLRMVANFRTDPRCMDLLRRGDYRHNLFGTRTPQFHDDLVELPLPVTPHLHLPIWHTMAFVYPRALYDHVLAETLRQPSFYYLLHPSDLLCMDDIPPQYRTAARQIERITVPLSTKYARLERAIRKIQQHSARMTTLGNIADMMHGG